MNTPTTFDSDARASTALNIWDVLMQQCAQRPRATAVRMGETTRTFEQFASNASCIADQLLARGVLAGDRVAVISQNSIEFLELLFACARVGAILACQNWRQVQTELAHCLALVQPKLVCASDRFAPEARDAAPPEAMLVALSDLAPRAHASTLPDYVTASQPGGEAGLYILYTSGTTGFPKAALISHRAALARVTSLAIDRPQARTGAFVAWSPFFHMGSTDASLAALLLGGTVIVMDGFDSDLLATLVAREPIGHLNIVPGVVERFLESLRRLEVRPRGVGVVGVMAELVPPHLLTQLTSALQAPYCNTFGATETGSAPASRGVLAIGVEPTRLSKLQNTLCAVRIIDEAGHEVPTGTPGELTLRSPSLFSGYWGDPQATAQAFRDGWYHMGDVFVRNEDGTLDFVDRRKYLIKSGGENIYPAEVERVLMGIAGVNDAVVVKQADPRWGEVPVAIVVPADPALTALSVIEGCRGVIASYKLPRRVVFASSAALPRNVSGKVERIKLERYLAACDPSIEWLPEKAFQ